MSQILPWEFAPMYMKKYRVDPTLNEASDKTLIQFSPVYEYACRLIYTLLEHMLIH